MRTLSLSYSTSTGKLSLVSDTSTVEGNVNDNNAITISVTGLPQSYLSAKIEYGVIIENNNTGTYYPFSELSGGSCTIPRRICRAATSGYLPIGLKITYANEDVECSVNQLRIKLGTWRDAEDSMMDAFGDQIMTRGASWDWLSGWTYQEGAVVVHNDIFWRSLDDDNKGHEPQEGSSYWEYVSPIDVDDTVSTSSTNPVENQAITNYVNQLVATAAGTFMGNLTLTDLGLTYPATDSQIATALGTYEFSEEPTVNDFVIITVNNPSTTTVDKYEQFRFDGTAWQHEYDIDISAFTTTQWDAINSLIYNSGSTALDVVDVQSHIASTSNPHSVTKAQVGLGNCDNTSDEDKPVSTAQASAIGLVQGYLDAHEANLSNPHQVTKSQVGLGNVDNYGSVDAWQGTPDDSHIPTEKLVKDSLDAKVDDTQLVTSWQSTPDNTHIPSEKLTKDTLDGKLDDTQLVTSFQATPDNTHIPSEKLLADSLTDGSVTKIGTANVGTDTKPIKLVAGVPTAVTNDLVDLTSAQTITALKTFTQYIINTSGGASFVTKRSTLPSNRAQFSTADLVVSPISIQNSNDIAFGQIAYIDTANTSREVEMGLYSPTANGWRYLRVVDNGEVYSTAPYRTYSAGNTDDVATIGTLDAYTPMLRTTGNQDFSGIKRASASGFIRKKSGSLDLTTPPSATITDETYVLEDKNGSTAVQMFNSYTANAQTIYQMATKFPFTDNGVNYVTNGILWLATYNDHVTLYLRFIDKNGSSHMRAILTTSETD